MFRTHPCQQIQINSKFTEIEHSYFVADFIWSQDIAARICLYFYQCAMDL